MKQGLATAAAALIGVAVFGGTAHGGVAHGPTLEAATQIELVDQTTWAQVGGNLDLRVRVTDAPSGATIQMTVHDQLATRQAFTDSLSGQLGDTEAASTPQPVVLDSAGTMQITYPVGAGGAELGRDDHGVYPASVTVADAAGQVLDELVTYLVLQPDPILESAFPPLAVAVILDVGAPPALQPDGTVVLGVEEQAAIDSRVALLNELPGTPVAVAPMPETLDALADDATTQPTLDLLAAAARGREILPRPYVELDLGALAGAGMLSQVAPQANAGARAIRTHLGSDPVGGIWLAGPAATTTTAGALQELGVTRAVVPSGALAGVPDDTDLAEAVTGPVALADDGPAALVADDALAERLLGQEGRLDAQRFVAELAMIWALAPSHARGVVVEIPSQAPLDREMVTSALTALTEPQSVVRPVTVEEMFTVTPPGGGEAPAVVDLSPDADGAAPANLDGIADGLVQAQTELNGLAGMLDNGNLIRSLQRSLWVAPGSQTADAERQAYVDRVGATEGGFAAAINAPATFRITLTAREGTIPLSIDNTSDQVISVRVQLTSSQMEFPDGSVVDLDVPPGGERVDLDVRLRASGAFPLGVTITSPDGTIVLDRTTFTIRSTAVSGVGLVLSIGAGLFLLIWWARHWRTARRSSRLIQEHPASHSARTRAMSARRN